VAEAPDWFLEWVLHHATLFGMDTDPEKKTLLSWRELFVVQLGYSREEMFAASDAVATSLPVPRFRNEHLDRLQAAVQKHRRETLTRRREAEAAFVAEQSECPLCLGCAWVTVPHPRDVVDGEWLGKHTLAVLCGCPLGRREQALNEEFCQRPRAGETRRRPKAMTLDEYEVHCPQWQIQVKRQEAADRAVRRAKSVTEDVDRARGRLPGAQDVLRQYRGGVK
jgi:hypothetical protein